MTKQTLEIYYHQLNLSNYFLKYKILYFKKILFF